MTTPTPGQVAEKLAKQTSNVVLDHALGFQLSDSGHHVAARAILSTIPLLEYEQLRQFCNARPHLLNTVEISTDGTGRAGLRGREILDNLNTALREKGIEP